jgi:hypothetical protein
MNKVMNRMNVSVGTAQELEVAEKEVLKHTSVKERLQTITYLRECFYGTEATTGRLHRFYKVFRRT